MLSRITSFFSFPRNEGAVPRERPLPEVHHGDPMRPNPPTGEFSRKQFRDGQVAASRLRELYAQQAVQHRGPTIVRNEEEFTKAAGISLARNGNFESTIATLGPALFGHTGGTHPVVDWQQPVPVPPDHPKINFARLIKAQELAGFPNETRPVRHASDAEHDDSIEDDTHVRPSFFRDLWEAAEDFSSRTLNLDAHDV